LKDITGGAPVREGKVKLEIPHLAENGHLVPLSVSVDSPMTSTDYVRTLYLLSEKNPRPMIAKIGMTPGMGRAALTTRIRLAGAQYVMALAQMSDGSFWAGTTEVIVTETACMDAA
jgi:sulfur-oxidizing protein SoxY